MAFPQIVNSTQGKFTANGTQTFQLPSGTNTSDFYILALSINVRARSGFSVAVNDWQQLHAQNPTHNIYDNESGKLDVVQGLYAIKVSDLPVSTASITISNMDNCAYICMRVSGADLDSYRVSSPNAINGLFESNTVSSANSQGDNLFIAIASLGRSGRDTNTEGPLTSTAQNTVGYAYENRAEAGNTMTAIIAVGIAEKTPSLDIYALKDQVEPLPRFNGHGWMSGSADRITTTIALSPASSSDTDDTQTVPAPEFLADPKVCPGRTVYEGESVLITTETAGATAFQWYRNNVRIPGATCSTYSFRAQLNADGSAPTYSVRAFNSAGAEVDATVNNFTMVIPEPIHSSFEVAPAAGVQNVENNGSVSIQNNQVAWIRVKDMGTIESPLAATTGNVKFNSVGVYDAYRNYYPPKTLISIKSSANGSCSIAASNGSFSFNFTV